MKIYHFSDTHSYHSLLNVPDNIDIAIFSGDCSNPRDKYTNSNEVLDFIYWYSQVLKSRYKIFVAGNHDTSIEARLITKKNFDDFGIIYLENETVEIEGLKIWGSPVTPSFGVGWAFNKRRDKLHDLWQTIPDNTDIIVTHGPPKNCLDLSYSVKNELEFCGCVSLAKRCRAIEPKLVCFGHIHNCEDIINAGEIKFSNHKTIYSNGSVVTDGKFGMLSSHGRLFEF